MRISDWSSDVCSSDLSAAVEGLLTEGRRISGVRVSANGGTETHEARVGVVLASGGFSANEQLRKAYIPYADQHVSILPYENVGDGMNMGLEVGASLDEIGRASCRERVRPDGEIQGGAELSKQKTNK